jgi:hypothetical protein
MLALFPLTLLHSGFCFSVMIIEIQLLLAPHSTSHMSNIIEQRGKESSLHGCVGQLEMFALKLGIQSEFSERAKEEKELVEQEAKGALTSLQQQLDRLGTRLLVHSTFSNPHIAHTKPDQIHANDQIHFCWLQSGGRGGDRGRDAFSPSKDENRSELCRRKLIC